MEEEIPSGTKREVGSIIGTQQGAIINAIFGID